MKELERDRLTKVGGKVRKREWNAKGESESRKGGGGGGGGEMEEPEDAIEEEKEKIKIVNSPRGIYLKTGRNMRRAREKETKEGKVGEES